MLIKMNITWNAKQMVKMFQAGKISVRNIVQRSLVWEDTRKSELIHSMIEGYPIPPFYARRTDGKVYDFLDGKQRLNAISGFLNDEYSLRGISEVTLDNGEMMDINGYKFSALPEEIQDRVKDYSLTIYYYDGITDEEVRTLFCKLNNGKPLSSKEKNIAYCKDIVTVSDIANHDLFKEILTAKGLDSRKNVPMVMKIHLMLHEMIENVSFESKDFNIAIQESRMTDAEKEEIIGVLNRYHALYNLIEEKEEKRVAKFIRKKMATEVHMVSLMPFIKKSIDENISLDLLVGFMKDIFCRNVDADGKVTGTYYVISADYDNAAKSGSAKNANIMRRHEEIEKAWNEYFTADDAPVYFDDTAADSDEQDDDNEFMPIPDGIEGF